MKIAKTISLLAMSAMMANVFVACSDDDDDEKTPSTEAMNPDAVTVQKPTADQVLEYDEQVKKLQVAAEELMKAFPSSDFQQLADLGNYFDETYGDYDTDEMDNWYDDIISAAKKQVGKPVVESDTSHYEYEDDGNIYEDTYIYNTITTDYTSLLLASSFKSSFTASKDKWTRKDADHFEVNFTDEDGKKCVLSVVPSGKETKLHLGVSEDYDWDHESFFSEDGKSYTGIYTETYDNIDYTIGVPEKLTATLTQDGKTLVSTTVNIDLSGLKDSEFSFSSSSVGVTSVTSFYNGLKVDVSRASYEAEKKIETAYVISKDSKALVSGSFRTLVGNAPKYNFSDLDEKAEEDDIDAMNLDSVVVKVDILGLVQLQGTVKDGVQLKNYLEEADDNYKDKDAFQSALRKANKLMEIHLMYDGTPTAQAKVTLEPFAEESYWDGVYWDYDVTLNFYDEDQTTESFGDFFSEVNFKKTTKLFEDLMDDYEDLVD